jgi:hypothetical protein
VVTHHVMAQPLDNAEPSSTALPALAAVISQELPSVLVTIVDLPVPRGSGRRLPRWAASRADF